MRCDPLRMDVKVQCVGHGLEPVVLRVAVLDKAVGTQLCTKFGVCACKIVPSTDLSTALCQLTEPIEPGSG